MIKALIEIGKVLREKYPMALIELSLYILFVSR